MYTHSERKQVRLILFGAFIVAFLILGSGFSHVLAQPETVVFPVTELGNCENEAACRVYCDIPGNMGACLDFAERHNLMTPEELRSARQFERAGGVGPGGCQNENECRNYCDDITHIDECLGFAEEHDLLDEVDLDEAKKIRTALASGAQLPGGCTSKEQCEQYCQPDTRQPERMRECLAFAEVAGFMDQHELDEAKKVLAAIERGVEPPPCQFDECEAYCSDPNNFDQCFNFAVEAGLLEGEADSHMIEVMKKTRGRGPGGCVGRECEIFCENPDNQQACFDFAKEHDLLTDEHREGIEDGRRHMIEAFQQSPEPVRECLYNTFGADFLDRLISGDAILSPDMAGRVEACLQSFGDFGGSFDDGEHQGRFDLPPDVVECVKDSGLASELEHMMQGDGPLSPGFENQVRNCFERLHGQFGDDDRDRFDFPGQFDEFDHQDFDDPFGTPEFEDVFRDEFEDHFEDGTVPTQDDIETLRHDIEERMRMEIDYQMQQQFEEDSADEFFDPSFDDDGFPGHEFSPEDIQRMEEFKNQFPGDFLDGGPTPEKVKEFEEQRPPQSLAPPRQELLLGNLFNAILKLLGR